jgi:hypothetical protein
MLAQILFALNFSDIISKVYTFVSFVIFDIKKITYSLLVVYSRSISAPNFTCTAPMVHQLIVIKMKDEDSFRTLPSCYYRFYNYCNKSCICFCEVYCHVSIYDLKVIVASVA